MYIPVELLNIIGTFNFPKNLGVIMLFRVNRGGIFRISMHNTEDPNNFFDRTTYFTVHDNMASHPQ